MSFFEDKYSLADGACIAVGFIVGHFLGIWIGVSAFVVVSFLLWYVEASFFR